MACVFFAQFLEHIYIYIFFCLPCLIKRVCWLAPGTSCFTSSLMGPAGLVSQAQKFHVLEKKNTLSFGKIRQKERSKV